MPKKNKLYQCPYELACKCDLRDPCLGCETWAEHYGKFNSSAQQPQERNICDTIVEYMVFYPAGSLHIGGSVNVTALTIYYSK
jgi:hypothetical protein